MADAIDGELIALINKLNKIQKEVGGGKKTKTLADGHGKIDRFLDLTQQIGERLEVVRSTIEDIRKLEKVPGSNPKDLITCQSRVRSELSAMTEEWRELDTIFRIETKKRRSRFSPEELKERQDTLVSLQNQIQEVREMQRSGYVKGYKGKQMTKLEDSEMFKAKYLPDPTGTNMNNQAKGVQVGGRNNNMTEEHRMQLMAIRETDARIDEEIEQIGVGVDQLRELAMAANEEVKVQNRMLDTLESKIEDVHEHVTNVNEKLKVTLDKARKGDKMCMDIFCLLVLIGMIIVLVKVSTGAKK